MVSLPGFPYGSKTVQIDGHTMAYVDEGSGPPVLLVHGNPTWSFYYRELIAHLVSHGRRAIAPDHVGMGRSDKPAAKDYPHTLSRRVNDLTAFIDRLDLQEPLSLVVHDWGGAIGLAWAVDHVEQLDKLVVLNTGAFPLPPTKSLPWTLRAARLPVLGDLMVRRLNAFSLGSLYYGSGKFLLPKDARRGMVAPYDSPAHRVAVAEFVKDIPTSEHDAAWAVLDRTERRLHRLEDVPTQVWWGLKDPVFDEGILDHLLTYLPKAEVHRLPEAGHYVLEDAAEQIVPMATSFLTG